MSVIEVVPGENALADRGMFTRAETTEGRAVEFDNIDDLYGRVIQRASDEVGVQPNLVLESVFETVRSVDLSSSELDGAFIVASILDNFRQEGVIRGSVSTHIYHDAKTGKDGRYAKYTTYNGRRVILDIENGFLGMMPDDDVHPAFWRYMGVDEKRRIVGEQTRRILDGEDSSSGLDAEGNRNINFVLSVLVDKV